MIEFQTVVFYLFSAIALTAALGVVLVSNPVYASLFLVLAFIASAGLWLLLHAEFLAVVLVLVYVGAVMVLFLFVLMMLDVNFDRKREGFWRLFPIAGLLITLLAAQLIFVVTNNDFISEVTARGGAPADDNTRALGGVLYTEYVYPFELTAVLLLVAIVAAVALTLRRRRGNKNSPPEKQVLADASRRVRLVSVSPDSALHHIESSDSTTVKGG